MGDDVKNYSDLLDQWHRDQRDLWPTDPAGRATCDRLARWLLDAMLAAGL